MLYFFSLFRLNSYLCGTGPTSAHVTCPEHLLIAQDPTVGVLLVVQELLEGVKSILGVGGAGNLLQEPADLIWVVLHLEKGILEEHEENMSLMFMLQSSENKNCDLIHLV